MKFTPAVAAIAVALWLPIQARADVGSQMDSMIGTMSNYTPPGAVQTSSRSVLSGGSMYVRTNLKNTNLLNFSPPSIQSGCSGINIFGGSLSFISDQQFMTLLRNIPAAAAGYAFQLALNGICPECMTALNQLQKVVQDMNQLTRNSCQMAKGLVTVGDDLAQGKDMQTAINDSVFKNVSQDFSSAFSDTNPIATNQSAPNSVTNNIITGNLVWRALNDQEVTNWFGGDNGQSASTTIMLMMSVMGTRVVTVQPSAGTGTPSSPSSATTTVSGSAVGNDSNYHVSDLPAIVQLDDLLKGDGTTNYMQCSGSNATATDETGCLTTTTAQLTNFSGFEPMILDLLLGTDRQADSDGVVYYLRQNSLDTAPAKEIAVFHALQGIGADAPLVKIVKELCTNNSMGPAIVYVNNSAGVMSLYLAKRMIDDYFAAARLALSASQYTQKSQVIKQLDERQKELGAQFIARRQGLPKDADLLSYYNQLKQFADLKSWHPTGVSR